MLDGKITDWFRVTQCVAGSQSTAAQRKRARRECERAKEAGKETVSQGKWALAWCDGIKHFIIDGYYVGRRANSVSREGRATSRTYLENKQSNKKRTRQPQPATICSINPLWEERKGAQAASAHARADTHNRRWQIYCVRTHTGASQSRVFWQLLARPRKHMHQSLAVFFLFFFIHPLPKEE